MGIKSLFGKFLQRGTVTQGDGFLGWLRTAGLTSTGLSINRETALQISTVFGCVRVLSETLATQPLITYKRLPGGGKERATEHPNYRLLRLRPNQFQTAAAFKESLMLSSALEGNAFIHIMRNGAGQPAELIFMRPDRVEIKLTASRQKSYTYTTDTGFSIPFRDDEVIHIPSLPGDGVRGMSPLKYGAESMAMAKAAENHGGLFFKNAAKPAGAIRVTKPLSPIGRKNLKDSFQEDNTGENMYRPMLLEEGVEWVSFAMSNEQAQFMELRRFSVADICRWFRVPPHLVFDLERATFSNIEQQSMDFLTFTMLPWFVKYEEALTMALFTEEEQALYFCEFLVDAMLRADSLTRNQVYQIQRMNGIINADEWRERENMNPLPDGKGKEYITPLNMQSTGQQQPNPDKAPKNEPTKAPEPSAKPPKREEDLLDAFTSVARSQISRLYYKEAKAWNAAIRKDTVDTWRPMFYEKHASLIEETFLPIHLGIYTEIGVDSPETFASCHAADFARCWIKFTQSDEAKLPSWDEEDNINKLTEMWRSVVGASLAREVFESKHPTAVRNVVQLQPIVNVDTKPMNIDVTVEQPVKVLDSIEAGGADGKRVYKLNWKER